MTKVRFHGPIAGFSGAMGEMVFADTKEKNRTTAYMKTHYTPTQAQLDHQAHWKESASRAKQALENPTLRAFYETIAVERDVNTFVVAFTDFLVAPTFKPLDLSEYKGQVGDKLTIWAKDDIGLVHVDVNIVAQDGTPIEGGQAIEDGVRSGKWIYTATRPVALGTDVFIEIKGADHAGTKAQLSENPTVGVDA
jgi:hypothetical protein